MQHAKRMRCIILLSVVFLTVPHFLTLSDKPHDFREKVIGHKMCVLIFSTNFSRNIFHFKKNSVRRYHKFEISSYNVPVMLVRY